MSGGAIAVVPAMLLVPVLAAGAGPALAAGLVVRAARAGTEATGRALEAFADELERQGQAQDTREVQARLWELAAGAVLQTNQQMRLLAGRAARAGVRIGLPEPFDLTGHGLSDARSWVEATQQTLAEARAEVERAEAGREQRQLLGQLPAPADDSLSAAALLARVAKALADRPRWTPNQRPSGRPRANRGQVTAVIEQIVAGMHTDATAVEREQVIRAAAQAARQRDPGMSHTYVEALAGKVEQVNANAVARADAAGWLDALEHPVIVEAIAELTPSVPLGLSDRLRAVVRGDADLTEQDQQDAREALARAQRRIDCRRLLEATAETLASLGFTVTTGTTADHRGKLSVARDSWRGAHRADVVVDHAGAIEYRLVELVPDAPAEATRCRDLNQAFTRVGDALAARGYDTPVPAPTTLEKALREHGGYVSNTSDTGRAELAARAIDPRELT